MIHRRNLLMGIGSLFAAPAVVKAEILMPVKPWVPLFCVYEATPFNGGIFWNRIRGVDYLNRHGKVSIGTAFIERPDTLLNPMYFLAQDVIKAPEQRMIFERIYDLTDNAAYNAQLAEGLRNAARLFFYDPLKGVPHG